MMRIAILTPSCRDPKWGYVESLFRLLDFPDIKWDIHVKTNSTISQGREYLLSEGIKAGYPYALWVDDDMALDPSAVRLLLNSIQELQPDSIYPRAAVACNYVRKSKYPEWVAVRDGHIVPSDVPATGVERVDSVGMGLFLLDLGSVRHLAPPNFSIMWDHDAGCYIGEDVAFCRRLRSAGIDIFINHDASRMVRHIGDFAYDHTLRMEKTTLVPAGMNPHPGSITPMKEFP